MKRHDKRLNIFISATVGTVALDGHIDSKEMQLQA